MMSAKEAPDCKEQSKALSNPERTILNPIVLDASKTILWDHHPCGAPILISLSYYKNPSLLIKDRILGLACRYLERSKKDAVRCHFLGSVGYDTGPLEEGIRITLNQFEEDEATSQTISGDIIVPTMCGWKVKSDFKTDAEQYLSDLNFIYHSCSTKSVLDIANFIRIRFFCTYQGIHCSIHTEMVTFSTVFKATPIPLIPLNRTSFVKDLSGPKSSDRPQTGFLSMDQNKRLLVLLEYDSNLTTLPIVGIWVSGVATVYHPFVWAACIRYITFSALQNRLCLPPQPFLIAIFSPLHSNPEFYDCITSTGGRWLTFDLYKGKAATSLAKVPISNSRITTFEFNKFSKEAPFEDAVKKVIQVTAKTMGNASVISNLDDIPQLCPTPKTLKNISVQHSVPDLSLISDNGIYPGSVSDNTLSTNKLGIPSLPIVNQNAIALSHNHKHESVTDKSSPSNSNFAITEVYPTISTEYGPQKQCSNKDIIPDLPGNITAQAACQFSILTSSLKQSNLFPASLNAKAQPYMFQHISEDKTAIPSSVPVNLVSPAVEQNKLLRQSTVVIEDSNHEYNQKTDSKQILCVSDTINKQCLQPLIKNSTPLHEDIQYQHSIPVKSNQETQESETLRNPTEREVSGNLTEGKRAKSQERKKNVQPGGKENVDKLKSCLHKPEKIQNGNGPKSLNRVATKKNTRQVVKHAEVKADTQKLSTHLLSTDKQPMSELCRNKSENNPSEALPHVFTLLQHQDKQLQWLQEKINLLLENRCPQSEGTNLSKSATPVVKSSLSSTDRSCQDSQTTISSSKEINQTLHIQCSHTDKNETAENAVTQTQDSEKTIQTNCAATMTSFSWPNTPQQHFSLDQSSKSKHCCKGFHPTEHISIEENITQCENKIIPENSETNCVECKKCYELNAKEKHNHLKSSKESQTNLCVGNINQRVDEKQNSQLAETNDSLIFLEDVNITTCDQITSPVSSIHVDVQDFQESTSSQNVIVKDHNVGKIPQQIKEGNYGVHVNSLEPKSFLHSKHITEEDPSIPDKTFYRNIVGNVNKILSSQEKGSQKDLVNSPKHSPCVAVNKQFLARDGHHYKSKKKKFSEKWNIPHLCPRESLRQSFHDRYIRSSHVPPVMYNNPGYTFSDTDVSMAVNALAVKYFGEEPISALLPSNLSHSPYLRNLEDYHVFDKFLGVGVKDSKPSDLTMYGISSSNISFATRRYLEKYDLSGSHLRKCNLFIDDEENLTNRVSLKEVDSDLNVAAEIDPVDDPSVQPCQLPDISNCSESSLWIFSKTAKNMPREKLETPRSKILDIDVLRQQPKLL